MHIVCAVALPSIDCGAFVYLIKNSFPHESPVVIHNSNRYGDTTFACNFELKMYREELPLSWFGGTRITTACLQR